MQLGLDPIEYARGLPDTPFTPEQDRPGPYLGRGNEHAAGDNLAALLNRLMCADIAAVSECYDRACCVYYPGGVHGRGYSAVEKFWVALRSAFPSAHFSIDHQIGRDDPGLGVRAAIRWSLRGTHDGWGYFGAPSHADVYIMGFTHAEFGPWGLRREYTLFDEAMIWKQILLQTG